MHAHTHAHAPITSAACPAASTARRRSSAPVSVDASLTLLHLLCARHIVGCDCDCGCCCRPAACRLPMRCPVSVRPAGFNGVSYRLHTTQAEQGAWSRELGANERGLNTLYLWAFFAAAALLAAHAHSTVQLHAALHYLHPLLRLFLLLLLGQTLALLAMLLHYGTYARDGAGSPGLRNFGAVADCASRAALVLLLLLLGKGWTLSSERLTQRGAVAAVALAHLALGLVVALWGTNDDGTAADEVRSGPGAVRQLVAFLHASAWAGCGVWFCLLVWSSAKSELKDADKRHLYMRIGAVFAPWSVAADGDGGAHRSVALAAMHGVLECTVLAGPPSSWLHFHRVLILQRLSVWSFCGTAFPLLFSSLLCLQVLPSARRVDAVHLRGPVGARLRRPVADRVQQSAGVRRAHSTLLAHASAKLIRNRSAGRRRRVRTAMSSDQQSTNQPARRSPPQSP